jgi:L-ascorbate metabolism protein UlaG (beta-lactamase superfamily)
MSDRPFLRPLFALSGLLAAAVSAGALPSAGTPESVLAKIVWLGHACLRIDTGDAVVLFDPATPAAADVKADLILVTHGHSDHWSRSVVQAALKPGGQVAAPFAVDLPGAKRIQAGEVWNFAGVTVEAVPAYNVVATQYHPKSAGGVGYVVTVDGVRVYVAGDTERIPEMAGVRAGLAFLPIGTTYTMRKAADAVAAAADTGAAIAVPYHWGQVEGSKAAADAFAAAVAAAGTQGVVLTAGK